MSGEGPAGNRAGIALRVLSGLMFVSMAAIVRLLAGAIPIGELLFFRSLMALPPLLLYLAWRRQLPRGLITRRPGAHALRSLYGCLGMFAGFSALYFLPLAEAQALNFLSPIFVVILAGLLLREGVPAIRWLGVLLGFVGVLVMIAPALLTGPAVQDPAGRLTGVAFALLGALTSALGALQIRRLGASETPGAIAFYFALVCGVVSLLTIPLGWVRPDGPTLCLLLAMGLLGGLGQITMTLAFARTPASVLAPFDYLSMLWALGYGILLFDEWPSPWTLAGAAIVVLAVVLVAQMEGRRRSEAMRRPWTSGGAGDRSGGGAPGPSDGAENSRR